MVATYSGVASNMGEQGLATYSGLQKCLTIPRDGIKYARTQLIRGFKNALQFKGFHQMWEIGAWPLIRSFNNDARSLEMVSEIGKADLAIYSGFQK